MSSTEYVISRSTVDNIPGIVTILLSAFADNPLTPMLYPDHLKHLTPREEFLAWHERRLRKRLAGDGYYFKATPVDQPDLVVGYAHWFGPGHFIKGQNKRSERHQEDEANGAVPACVDMEVEKEFGAKIDQLREDIWGDDSNYWYLSGLAVHPDHQRQGIAGKLMQFGLDRADAEGLPVYLEATNKGAAVYTKYGFEPRGDVMMMHGKHTDKVMIRRAPMCREPQPKN